MKSTDCFIKKAPKAELHVHLEGTLEPEMVIMLAARNNIQLPFAALEELRAQYIFKNLQSFLDLYSSLVCVLIREEDFFDLTCAYLNRAQKNNIRHAELFFDAQVHVKRGVSLEVVISGIKRAFAYGNSLGISCHLIMCFLRDHTEAEAHLLLQQALPFKDDIIAVGLASAEKGNPPRNFVNVFKEALSQGFLTVAHAGEEGPVEYIWQAIELLRVSRIDHGNASIQDPLLVKYLADTRIPLTMCPLSNMKLQVIQSLDQHPAKFLLDAGVCVSIHSDDPAYFGGYLNDNLKALVDGLDLSSADIYAFLKNSFEASFLPQEKKAQLLLELQSYWNSYRSCA